MRWLRKRRKNTSHLKVAGVEYRIAYQIKEQEIVVVVMQIGTRENFYVKLKSK
jgi:mRNA-degrading endonuclease RelE of RelBE toxin-antitoxin system